MHICVLYSIALVPNGNEISCVSSDGSTDQGDAAMRVDPGVDPWRGAAVVWVLPTKIQKQRVRVSILAWDSSFDAFSCLDYGSPMSHSRFVRVKRALGVLWASKGGGGGWWWG